jgi:hypothetical protein
MRRSGSLVFAWLFALMLVASPVLPAGITNLASAQAESELPGDESPPDDGTPIAEPTATETATEPAPTETPVDEPTDEPTLEPSPSEDPVTETPTEVATEEPTETETTEPTSTATPEETEEDGDFSVAALSDIVITLSCTTDPETIKWTTSPIVNCLGTEPPTKLIINGSKGPSFICYLRITITYLLTQASHIYCPTLYQ